MTTEQRDALRDTKLPAAVGIAALVVAIWIAYVSRIAHFDVDVFLRAGAAVANGRDPYPPAGTPEVYSGFAFVYPYLMALPFVPLTWLHVGAEVFIGASVLAVLYGARQAGAHGWRTFALVLAASCTIIGLQMGTLNALLFLGLAGLWRLRERPLVAGILTALLVYSKLFLAPVWLWLVLTRRRPAAGWALAGMVLLFGVGQLVSPVGTETYAGMLSALARAEAPDGMSATGLLINLGIGVDAAGWAARLAAVSIVAGCALAVRRGYHERLLFTGVVTAALIASPIVWAHYLLLLLVPVLVVTTAPRRHDLPDTARPDTAVPDTAVPDTAPADTVPPNATPPNTDQRRQLAIDAPVAAFTISSWFVVTPHRSSSLDIALAAVVVGFLALPPLLTVLSAAAHRLTARDRLMALTRAAAVAAVAIGAFLALRAIASSHGTDGHVVGAYCALIGMIAILAWAAHRSTGTPEPSATRPDLTASA